MLSFIERGIKAFELIEDEIDRWITYDAWCQGKPSTWSESQLEQRWLEELQSCKTECLYIRNQWLMPRFEGVERRRRSRTTQEIEIFRQVDIRNAESMEQLWQSGVAGLERWQAAMPTVSVAAPLRNDPSTSVRPEDMPLRVEPQLPLCDSIAREVISLCF